MKVKSVTPSPREAAIKAMRATQAALKLHRVVTAQADNGTTKPVTRETWYRACANLLKQNITSTDRAVLKRLKVELMQSPIPKEANAVTPSSTEVVPESESVDRER